MIDRVVTPAAARFGIGEVVRHRLFPFRGVIFDVDPEFANSDEWWEAIPEASAREKINLSITFSLKTTRAPMSPTSASRTLCMRTCPSPFSIRRSRRCSRGSKGGGISCAPKYETSRIPPFSRDDRRVRISILAVEARTFGVTPP